MSEATNTGDVLELYRKHLNPGMAILLRLMGLENPAVEGEGMVVRDTAGKEYLDFLAGYGVFNLGHRHPRVVAAVKDQLERLPLSTKVLPDESTALLARCLAEVTPGDLQYCFFANSGAEAVEGALKLARLATGRQKVVATFGAFHGKTLGALSVTGRDIFRSPCLPLLPWVVHVPFGEVEAAAEAVDEDTAAVIVEPLQGEGGIILPPLGYLRELRALCDRKGAALILDEVQTGMGRTGYLFACEAEGVVPDLLLLGKALGGGVMPVAAIVARPWVWRAFSDNPFIHTSTFGGNPLACRAALATLEVLVEENLPASAREKGAYFLTRLAELRQQYPDIVAEVRGRGLMLGVEFTDEGSGGFVLAGLLERGFLVAYTLNNTRVMRIEPPLIIDYREIDLFLQALTDILAELAR
ncbi:MAG: putrescine aminotransferase [Eubacteriales bacterium]|nr:putrescine aminotransferase [Eubacteriales bacterium]